MTLACRLKVTLQRFATHFKALKVIEALSRLKLFIQGFENIFKVSFVHNGKYRCFNQYGDDFHDNLKAIIPHYVNGADEFASDDLFRFRKYDYGHEIDYRLVYRYFLKLMKQKKLDLYYRPMYSDDNNVLYTDHGDWTRYQIEKMLSAKNGQETSIVSEAQEQQYKGGISEAEERELFKKIKIPQIVEAYYQVYHRLPENFPPVKEE